MHTDNLSEISAAILKHQSLFLSKSLRRCSRYPGLNTEKSTFFSPKSGQDYGCGRFYRRTCCTVEFKLFILASRMWNVPSHYFCKFPQMTGHESLSWAETSVEHTCENSQDSKCSAKLLSFHLCPRLQLLTLPGFWAEGNRSVVWPVMFGPAIGPR